MLEASNAAFLRGGGECGELIRSIDWSTTPLGSPEAWPPVLKSTVRIILGSRHPMFLWWGPDLIQFYNDAYRPSFGEGKHPRAMGQRGRECWGEIWTIIGPQIEQVMTRGEPTFHEDALVPIERNGRVEEVYWTYGYSPVFEDSGEIAGTLVICTETTSRVIANRRQQSFRYLAESISRTDAPHTIVQTACDVASTAHLDIAFALAIDSSGVLRATTDVASMDAQAQEVADAAGRAHARVFTLSPPLRFLQWPEPVSHAATIPTLDGTRWVFGLSPRLRFDDSYRAFLDQYVATVTSALEHSRTHALRAAAEQERRDLLLQAPVATALLTGPDHLFELANRHYVEMVGREVVGKTYLEAFPELRDAPLRGILDDVFLRGVPFVTHELHVPLDRIGSGIPQQCYFRFNLEPMRNADGKVFGMMAVAVDITAVVAAREEQRHAHEQLRDALGERERLVEQLTLANRTKDEFLAMLGHEMRNPLSPIVTALDLIALKGGDPFEREHAVIRGQADHLVHLVDDLLDVSKIARGKLELDMSDVLAGDVIQQGIRIAEHVVEERRHHLEVDLPEEPVRWYGDRVRLAQVVANLVTNAARYTEPGGTIRIAVRRELHELVITVTDTGVGIAADVLPTIFDLFVQGQRRMDRAQGGLGIGLTLVKNLVGLHGGTVRAESAGSGRGSEFTVRLPLLDTPAVVPKVGPRDPQLTHAKRILVVDDNVDAAMLVGELLQSRGHEVEVVHDAVAAVSAYERFRPDVAVLDIGLPVMDGYQLAERLRVQSHTNCTLIALTGYGQERDRAKTSAAGFDAHLVKPVKLDALLDAIARAG